MRVLSHLEPEKVFYFFEEISNIPRGSGNVEKISNYLADFARERGLFCIQDELKNIIIIKDATEGYEDEEPVILQGHMDMVAVKDSDCDINMEKDPLRLEVDGDYVLARGTSLGGDDGIAVAYSLALLDSGDLAHPRLEVVITVDEETGMDGARGIELSVLKGKRMVNLDSEDEGIFLSSCAGGARANCRLPLLFTEHEGLVGQLEVKGLQGGHSGAEIHKGRGNANVLLGRVLKSLLKKTDLGVVSMEGGVADNAIATHAGAVVLLPEEEWSRLAAWTEELEREIGEELGSKDSDFALCLTLKGRGMEDCVYGEEARRMASYLIGLPAGVQAMSADMEGLVETSLNLGVMKLKLQGLFVQFAVRSSVESAKYALIDKVESITSLAGGSMEIHGDYPGWKFCKESALRNKMVRVYEKMYGAKPVVEAIHAGLECGFISSKIEGLDCVAIGPDMKDIHTTRERLCISSTRRVWEYLVALLAERG